MNKLITEPTHRFLRACYGLPTDYTPIWMMRQAGRYLPEYQAVRSRLGFLDLCKTPDLAAEVTVQPIDRLGVDAAILFADILLICQAMGQHLEFTAGHGPRLEPVASESDIERLVVPDPTDECGFVMETVSEVRRRLAGKVPLIGFAGAPFTVATYMVEGGSSKSFSNLKRMMFAEPALYRRLLDKITEATTLYLEAQVEAGAEALQIFDSWAGALTAPDFRAHALPYVQRMVESLSNKDVPVIYYVGQAAHLIEPMVESGAEVLGVDWRLPLSEARRRIGGRAAVQGNLDPCVLLGPVELIEERARAVLEEAGPKPGHIFNLGHGILPETSPSHAKALVDTVHEYRRQAPA